MYRCASSPVSDRRRYCILPECFFLKKKFAVNKLHTKLEVLTPKPHSVPVLRGDALKYDNSWLFYAELHVGANKRDADLVLSHSDVQRVSNMCELRATHAMHADGERVSNVCELPPVTHARYARRRG